MNDSNNNNNTSGSNVTLQSNNTNSVNSIPKINDLINNDNQSQGSEHNINFTSTTLQNETYKVGPNITSIQPQNNFNTQISNSVGSSVNQLADNNISNQLIMQSNNNFSNNVSQQNLTINNPINDEELLRAFIGNNYEKITTKSFNFAGFFFTTFYMFYRKLFGYALLVFLLNIIVLNVIDNAFITIIFNVVVGLLVNKIYISSAKKKITKIKLENSQKGTDELKHICSIKGGTSVGTTFLGIFIELVIVIFVVITMGIFNITSVFAGLFSDIKDQTNTSQNGTYEGIMITNTSINMANEFSIEVPSKFENESDNYDYEYQYSSGNGVFDKCEISLSVPNGFSDAEDLINQMAIYYKNDNPTAVTKTNINNIDWHWFSIDDSFGKTYYYGTSKKNKVFLLQYNVNKDASSDCENYRQQIIDSIKSR